MISEKDERVKSREVFAYSAMNFGHGLLTISVSSFILYFFTDVVLLPVAFISAVLFCVRFFDGAIDPFISYYMDRRQGRFGKYKGYVLFWAVPCCVLHILLFMPVPLEGVALMIWCLVIYLTWSFAMSIIECASTPLLVTISSDPEQRRLVNTCKITAAILATLTARYLTLELADLFGESEADGYFTVMTLFALIGTAMILPGGIFIKERNVAAANNFSFLKTILAMAENKSLLFLLLMYLSSQLGSAIKGQAAIYYMKYYIGRQDLTSKFLVIGVLSSLLMQPVILWASKRIPYIRLMVVGYLGAAFGMLLIGFSGRSLVLLMLGNVVYGMLSAFPANLIYLHAANLADLYAKEKKASFHATINSILSLSVRLGTSLGGAIIALVLYLSSYSPNETQGDAALTGIQVCFVFSTILCYVGAGIFAIASSGTAWRKQERIAG